MKRHLALIIITVVIIFGHVFHTGNNWEYSVGNKEDTIKIRSLPQEDVT